MKYFVIAAALITALGMVHSIAPAQAQSAEVRALCQNKYGLGKNTPTASEGARKEAAAKIAACIRSGGKS
jgi:hypothetical protein